MEKFCEHIEKLLAQHDYVVVPNLGGFVVQMESAQIMPDSITPPMATVAFNPLMHHADGLLAIEIARSEQISYRQAMELIEKNVIDLKTELKSNSLIEFGKIGTFYQSEKDSIIFSPFKGADFLPGNFQLNNLHISPKSALHLQKQGKVTITLPSTRIFKYAAAAMILFGLFFTTPQITDTRHHAEQASLIPVSFKTIKTNNAKPQPAVIKVEAEQEQIQKADSITKSPENFYVIVASSSTKESAERYCKELALKEFPNAQVLPPHKTYRVAVQSFTTREEAIEYMEKLRETDSRFESSWVLCK